MNVQQRRRVGISLTDKDGELRWPPNLVVRLAPEQEPLVIDTMQIGAIATYFVVSVGAATAIWWFMQVGFTWFDALMLLASTFLIGLGTSLGYHRLFCHKAFEASRAVSLCLGILGAAALQGQIQVWTSVHRKHHHHSDRPGDPHSPRASEKGVWSGLASFFDSHVGWLLSGRFYCYLPYIRDLRRDRIVLFIDRWYWAWAAAGLIVPGLIGMIWYGDLSGFISGVFAGGILRTFVHLNSTWAVNSFGHLFGGRPFATADESSNNALVNFLSMNGEGLHNNHHAFPWSARFSLRAGELDPGYWILRLLARWGAVWNLKEPSKQQIASRLQATV